MTGRVGRSSFEQTLRGDEILICLRGGGASKAEDPSGGKNRSDSLQREAGAVRGRLRCYILHLRESTPPCPVNRQYDAQKGGFQ